jgi:hypothetical protein
VRGEKGKHIRGTEILVFRGRKSNFFSEHTQNSPACSSENSDFELVKMSCLKSESLNFAVFFNTKAHNGRGRTAMLVSLGCDVFGCHSVKIKGKRSGFPSAWP